METKGSNSSLESDAGGVTKARAPELAPAQFARNASGLIRSATLWDAFGINATNGLFVLGIAWLLLYAGPLYPGGNVFLTILMAVIVSLPVTLVYLQLAIVFPRSGGDYIYNSRLLHPSIGFAANVALTVGLIFWTAFGGVYVVTYGITPGLVTAGIQLHNQFMIDAGTWFQGSIQIFLLSVVVISLFGIFFVIGGNRAYFRFQKVAVILGGAALVVVVIYAFTASRTSALANLNELFKGMGAASATSMVKGKAPAFSFNQTYLMLWWAAGYIMSAFYSAYIGGEVKTPGRTQMLGGLGALVWMAGWTVLVVGAMFHLFGSVFFTNLGAAFDTSSFGPGLTPIYPTLIAGSIGNGYVTLALMACFSVFIIAVVGANMLLATRCIFAWGIDRIVPAWCSRVRVSSGSPTSATLMVVIGAVAFCFAYTYGYMTALGGSWMFLIVFLLLMVSGMILPYRNRAVWESSPNANRLLGLPTITWWGGLGFIAVVICSYVLIVDPNYGISPLHNLIQFLLAPIFVVGGLVWYYVARKVQAGKGINTDLNFSQIPPE
jgi:basic amino acid/polyamine antiporter, APA family